MAVQPPEEQPFSDQLEAWLKKPGSKTIADLNEVFGERTFAIALLLLLAPSSLPIPTGGLTNLFEVVAMILAIELIIGLRSIWLPPFLLRHKLSGATQKKAIPFFIRRIRWFERFAKPRMSRFTNNRLSLSVFGVFFLIFSLGAFVAPVFSGLDTLPSLGVLLLALGLIVGDVVLVLGGIVIGSAGIGLILALSSLVFEFITSLWT